MSYAASFGKLSDEWRARSTQSDASLTLFGIGFLIGVPAPWCWWIPLGALPLSAIAVLVGLRAPHRWSLVVGILTGVLWASHSVGEAMNARLSGDSGAVEARLSGWVEDGVRRSERGLSFSIFVRETDTGTDLHRVHLFVAHELLETVGTPESGGWWQGCARLRAPRSTVNPAGFDGEAWAFRNRVGAVGVVRGCVGSTAVAAGGLAAVRNELNTALRTWPTGGLLAALVTGDRAGIEADWQEWIRRTGTAHLFVISGLHLTFAGVCGWWLGALVSLTVPGLRWRGSLQPCALAVSAATLVAYAAVAGFSLPVQRALIMGLCAIAARLLGRRILNWRPLLLAAVVVLAVDPLATLDAGFWLSFTAVGALVLFANGTHARGALALVRAQTVVLCLLTPALLFWVGSAALLAWPANLVLVPLIGVCVVLPALLGAALFLISPQAASLLWWVADWMLTRALGLLEWLAGVHAPTVPPFAGALELALVCAIAVLLGFPQFRLSWIVAGALVLALAVPPVFDDRLEVLVLDSGQGLNVAVRAAGRVLLYDTGPGAHLRNAGLPSLRAMGWPQAELLIISHGDADHAAGTLHLRREALPHRLLAGEPERLPRGLVSNRCRRGQHWAWGRTHFEILHGGAGGSANQRSCVLLIRSPEGNVLLPGDIDTAGEWLIDRQLPQRLDLVLAPHHGSNTSSGPALADRTALVVFSAGFANSFGHPDRRVVERYRGAGARIASTAGQGAMLWAQGAIRKRWRCTPRPWRDPCAVRE